MLWTMEKNSYSFIHARDLLLSIRDWPRLIKQSYEYPHPLFPFPFPTTIPYSLSEVISPHTNPTKSRVLTTRHLKPGAYLELQCIYPLLRCDDGSTPPDSALMQFSRYALEASRLMGTPLACCDLYTSQMIDAGFEDVVEHRIKLPSGPWPKEKRLKLIGAFENDNLLRGLSGMSYRMFSKAFGWTAMQTEEFLVDVRRDLQNLRYHTYWDL